MVCVWAYAGARPLARMPARPPVAAAAAESCKVLRRRIWAMVFSPLLCQAVCCRPCDRDALYRGFCRDIEEMHPLGIDREPKRFMHLRGDRRFDGSNH